MSLVAEVREQSGATTDDATDDRVRAALLKTSVPFANLPVAWALLPTGLFARIGVLPTKPYTVSATGAADGVDVPVLHDALGIEVAGVSIAGDGTVTLDDPQLVAGVLLYATGRMHDPVGTAADIVAGMHAAAARDYDVARGDQKFERSQAVGQLKALLKDLRRRRIRKARREIRMLDQAHTSGRGYR